MHHVNLLDESLLPPPPKPSAVTTAVTAVVLALATFSHAGYEHWLLGRAMVETPAAVTADTAADQAGRLGGLQQRVAQRQALLDLLLNQQALPEAPAQTLEALLAALPDNAWLTEVELAHDKGLRIAGGVTDPQALSSFSRRLSAAPTLAGRPLSMVRLVDVPGGADPSDEGKGSTPPSHRFVLANVDAAEAGR